MTEWIRKYLIKYCFVQSRFSASARICPWYLTLHFWYSGFFLLDCYHLYCERGLHLLHERPIWLGLYYLSSYSDLGSSMVLMISLEWILLLEFLTSFVFPSIFNQILSNSFCHLYIVNLVLLKYFVYKQGDNMTLTNSWQRKQIENVSVNKFLKYKTIFLYDEWPSVIRHQSSG